MSNQREKAQCKAPVFSLTCSPHPSQRKQHLRQARKHTSFCQTHSLTVRLTDAGSVRHPSLDVGIHASLQSWTLQSNTQTLNDSPSSVFFRRTFCPWEDPGHSEHCRSEPNSQRVSLPPTEDPSGTGTKIPLLLGNKSNNPQPCTLSPLPWNPGSIRHYPPLHNRARSQGPLAPFYRRENQGLGKLNYQTRVVSRKHEAELGFV